MKSYFRVSADVEDTIWLHPTREGAIDELFFDGSERSRNWVEPEVIPLDPTMPRRNFFQLVPGALVFDGAALDALLDIFEMAGEILPVRLGSEQLHLLNVREIINAVDPTSAEWRTSPFTGEPLSLKRYAFRNGFLTESSLFKVPETRRADVLTYTGVHDPEDEFYFRYKAAGLTGLKFELVFEG